MKLNSFFILVVVLIALLCTVVDAKTKHQKMFEDLYLKSEEQLLADNFIATYATLIHRNIVAQLLIPSPLQESSWGEKTPFILHNPQPVNVAIATGKHQIAELIIKEVEKRRPRGSWDNYPSFAGHVYPLPQEGEEGYEPNNPVPNSWIEHQFVTVSVLFSEDKTVDYRGIPVMGLCVLTRDEACFDLLTTKFRFKPHLTSNHSYTIDSVMIAAQMNAYELVPKLVDIGAPFDMQERKHVLTQTSPWLIACSQGNVEFVEKLYQMGWDIDEQNGGVGGDTCLHVAAMKGHLRLTEWLLQHGADITITHEKDGQSAYSLSVMYHQRGAQALLGEAFLKSKLPLPRPPTPRQMIQDRSHMDEVEQYLFAFSKRTGITHQQIMENMDMVHYDPYYDFDGSYRPDAEIGNEIPNIDADRIPNGASGFLVEIDGVLYQAGTYTYRQKMLEMQEKERLENIKLVEERVKEHAKLMEYVDSALEKRRVADIAQFARDTSMPEHIKQQMKKEGSHVPDAVSHKLPQDSSGLFTTKVYNEYILKEQKAMNKDEL